MAIGYSPMGVPFKLNAQDMGAPDLQAAIMKGLQAGHEPQKMASELLGQHLTNAMNRVKAKHAEEMAMATLNHLNASTQGLSDEHSLLNLKRQKLMQDYNTGKITADLLNKAMNHLSNQQASGGGQEDDYDPITAGILKKTTGIDLYARSPKQKIQDELKKESAKLDLKEQKEFGKKYRESLNALKSSIQNERTVEDVLKRVHTGILPSIFAKTPFGGSGLGELNEPATRMQAELGRAISQRGGQGAAELAAQGKPSQWRSNAYNEGILKSIRRRQASEFMSMKDEYESTTGKPFPHKLKDLFKIKGGHVKMSLNGKVKKVPADRIEEFLAEGAMLE